MKEIEDWGVEGKWIKKENKIEKTGKKEKMGIVKDMKNEIFRRK